MISDGLLALKIKGLLNKCIFGQIFSLFLKSGIRPVISGRPYIRCKESKIFALKCCKLKWYSLKTHWVNFFFFFFFLTAKTVQYFHSSKRQPRWVRLCGVSTTKYSWGTIWNKWMKTKNFKFESMGWSIMGLWSLKPEAKNVLTLTLLFVHFSTRGRRICTEID